MDSGDELSRRTVSSEQAPCWIAFSSKECRIDKIVSFVVALIFVAISLTLHFQNINSIAVYATAASAGAIVVFIALHSVIEWIKQPKEISEDERGRSRIDLRDYLHKPQQLIKKGYGLPPEENETMELFESGAFSIERSRNANTPPFVFVHQHFTFEGREYPPGWYTAASIAYAIGNSADPTQLSPRQQAILDKGDILFFAPSLFPLAFSNCPPLHPESEPSIFMPDPMPDRLGIIVEFPSVAFYMEYFKYTLYLESLPASDSHKKKQLCSQYRMKINAHKDLSSVATMNEGIEFSQETLQKWKSKKSQVMHAAVYAKFSQNELHRLMLIRSLNWNLTDLTSMLEESKETESTLLRETLRTTREHFLTGTRPSISIGDKSFKIPAHKPEINYSFLQ